MDSKKLIDLIELKDKYACALMDYYINKGKTEGLQEYTDAVCESWAKVFIAKHKELFDDRQTQIEIFKYLDTIGANKPHSGKRFSEQLYKQLHILVAKQDKTELSK